MRVKRNRFIWAMLFLALVLFGGLLDSACPEALSQGRKTLYFPQFVVGGGAVLADGTVIDGWEWTYSVFNKTEQWRLADFLFFVSEMETPPLEFRFLDREGELRAPSTILFGDKNGHSIVGIGFILFPYNRRVRIVTGTPEYQGLATGWVSFKQSDDTDGLVASAKMTLYAGGRAVSTLEVPAVEARETNFLQIFVAERDRQQPGIAIVNPSDKEAVVTLQILKEEGKEFARKEIRVPPDGHLSRFFSELFPEFARDPRWVNTKTFGGILKISSNVKIPVLAINTRTVEGVGFLMATIPASK